MASSKRHEAAAQSRHLMVCHWVITSAIPQLYINLLCLDDCTGHRLHSDSVAGIYFQVLLRGFTQPNFPTWKACGGPSRTDLGRVSKQTNVS